jgi:hypothetical protein
MAYVLKIKVPMACAGAAVSAIAEIAAARFVMAIAAKIRGRCFIGRSGEIRRAGMRGAQCPGAEREKQNACYNSELIFNHAGNYTR